MSKPHISLCSSLRLHKLPTTVCLHYGVNLCVWMRRACVRETHLGPGGSALSRTAGFASFTLKKSRRMIRDSELYYLEQMQRGKQNSHPLHSFQKDQGDRENPSGPANINSRRIITICMLLTVFIISY